MCSLFEKFSMKGKLVLPGAASAFQEIPWTRHPEFAGVELKCIVAAAQTGGRCSFYLVRIAPRQKIGGHVHQMEWETHEVIAGQGVCIHAGGRLTYEPGVISIVPANTLHEVLAGPEGLCLFAKFMPV